jgi:arylsulfatase A-like enzyme
LAQDGVVYENAYANSSWSFPSLVSILTSHYPRTLETVQELTTIPQYVRTAPQILSSAGFDTVAITASSWFSPDFGVRGFRRFETVYDHTDLITTRGRHPATPAQREKGPSSVMAHSEDLHQLSFQTIEQDGGRDVFMMIWSLDTHPPYYVRGTQSRFGNSMDDMCREGEVSLDKLQRLYCDMLSYNCETFGLLIEKLKDAGIYEQSLLLVLSDHGVSFGEHDLVGHGRIVYEEQIRVPLIIKYPGNAHAGFRRSSRVQLADLLPTILDVCDIPFEDGSFEGTSLAPGSYSDTNRTIFSETHVRPGTTYSAAVLRGSYKFMKIQHPPKESLSRASRMMQRVRGAQRNGGEFTFDFGKPDGENSPNTRGKTHKLMAREYQAVLEHCERLRAELRAKAPPEESDHARAEVSPEVLSRLRALGYLEE